MPYTLYVAGLACFIEQDDDSFVIALPDGRSAKHPGTGATIPRHDAFLVVLAADVTTENWPAELGDGMAFLPIDPGATLTLPQADGIGTIDTSQYRRHMISWTEIDPNFKLSNDQQPNGSLATTAIRHGTLRMYRLQEADAMVVQIDIPFANPDDDYATIELTTSQGISRRVTFPSDSEMVLANISEERRAGGPSAGDEDHFLIYYVLNVGGKPPSYDYPEVDETAKRLLSRHPFLDPNRDLSVSCTPTNKP